MEACYQTGTTGMTHRKILDKVISQLFTGVKFNGAEIRFIPFKRDKLKEALRYATYIMGASREWLDKNADTIACYKHLVKKAGITTQVVHAERRIMVSKEEAEDKLNNLLQSFQKVFPFLSYMDGRDALYFWNHITDIIYENSFTRQYKLME